jgi:prepilin-type N-terminal cleavage/methylation domain-containing protein/prepilin-type processing-associated H-X9-DG protein
MRGTAIAKSHLAAMNPSSANRQESAFTLTEMLCVVAAIGILAALLLPVLGQGQARAERVQCVNNLKEIGIAFHVFAHDHRDNFPMQEPIHEGGSLEFLQNGYLVNGAFYFSFRHFLPLSNVLATPKLLNCPAELTRLPAETFASFRNNNLSYFVGVNSEFRKPNSVLAGDRNITNNSAAPSSIVHYSFVQPVYWTRELHRLKGNLLFADGRVELAGGPRVELASGLALANQDFVVPTAPPPTALATTTGNPTVENRESQIKRTVTPNPSPAPRSNDLVQSRSVGGALIHAREASVTDASPPEIVPSVEASSNAPASQSRPASSAPADSPFMKWFASAAQMVLRNAAWLLLLLLLLMVLSLLTIYARQRVRRKV